MSKILQKIVLTILTCFCVSMVFGQNLVRSDYQFTQFAGTYTALTGGTQLNASSSDDTYYPGISVGFPFRYNGQDYSTIGVGNNGFIAFLAGQNPDFSGGGSSIGGSGSSGGSALYSFNETSNNFGYGPIIAVFNMDLHSRAIGALTVHRTGTAPNRTFTVQWAGYERFSGSSATDNLNFQLVLSESNGNIAINYGIMSLPTGQDGGAQVGLRGSDTTDINARTGVTFANTNPSLYARQDIWITNNTTIPSGLVFSWQTGPPAAIDVSVINIIKPVDVSGTLCIASVTDSVTFNLRNYGGDSATSVPVYYTVNGGTPILQVFTFNPALQPRTTVKLSFPTPITLTSGAVFNIKVYCALAGEAPANRRNDTLSKTITFSSIAGNSSIYPNWTTDFGIRPTNNIPAGWFGELLSGTEQWRIDTGFFDPGNSLSIPIATQQGPGILFFPSFQTSTRGTVARASTPCLNLNNWPANEPAWLEFSMNQDADYPNFLDSIEIQVALNGDNYTKLAGFSRYNFNVRGYVWSRFAVDLSAYRNQIIRVAFVAKSKGGNNMGIDYATVKNTVPVTLNEQLSTQTLSIYPNPTTGMIQIKSPNVFDRIDVLNTLGQVVLSQTTSGLTDIELNLAPLAAGTYQVRVIGQGKQFSRRISKQ